MKPVLINALVVSGRAALRIGARILSSTNLNIASLTGITHREKDIDIKRKQRVNDSWSTSGPPLVPDRIKH